MWVCEDVKMWRWEDVKMRQMWRCEDAKISRCEDEQMWRWEDVKIRRCEDEQIVKMSRCEDEQMWRWADVKMKKVWRWEDVKMRRWDADPHYWKNPALRRSREKSSTTTRAVFPPASINLVIESLAGVLRVYLTTVFDAVILGFRI